MLRVIATGQIEADRRARIGAPATGRVAAVTVREGDRVSVGQVLVRFDSREQALAVQRAEAELAEAQARFREITLFDERIADPEVRRERAEAARARSGLARAEIALREARLAMAYTTVTAPFPGHVAEVRITLGEQVSATQELMTLVDLDPIHVQVQVVESELQWLREENGAEIRLTALPDTVFLGQITAINPVVDPESRTARVIVLVANPHTKILPGMFAQVTLEGRVFEDRVLVPKEAILERDGRTLVFLFEPLLRGAAGEGLAKWVYVTTGLANDRFVELVEGEGTGVPEPGRLVLTSGHITLIHDARVRVAARE